MMKKGMYLGVIIACVVQAVALFWYFGSYVPSMNAIRYVSVRSVGLPM